MNFNLLKSRRFLPLFITQFLEAFNDSFFKNALVILITYTLITEKNWAGFFSVISAAIFILPFLVFSATSGQLADKFDKSVLIRVIKIVEVAAMILAAIGFSLQSMTILFLTLLILGIHSTLFGPIKFAILPDHLKPEELIQGNALVEGSTFIAILLGTIFSGLFIALDSGSHIVSSLGVLIALIGLAASFFIPKTTPGQPDLVINYNIASATKNIIQDARKSPIINTSVIIISWFWALGSLLLTEIPSLVKNDLGAKESIVVVFLTLFSVGIAIGSLLAGRLQKTKIDTRWIPLSIIITSICLLDLFFACHTRGNNQPLISVGAFLLSVNNWRIMLDMFVLSVAGGFYVVPLYTLLQTESSNQNRARMIAANNIINSIFMAIASIIVGVLLALHFSIPVMFALIALINLFFAAKACRLIDEATLKHSMQWILQKLYRVKVIGLENYQDASKKAVIIANHGSLLDALLLTVFLPNKLLFAANRHTLKAWWLKPFLRLINTYEINPTSPMYARGLMKAIEEKNCHCIIFPEGRFSNPSALMKIYEMPALVADKTHADIIPIRIEGAQYTPFSHLRGKVRIRWFPEIQLVIEKPVQFDIASTIKGRARRKEYSAELYQLVTDLVFASSPYQTTLFKAVIDASKIYGAGSTILEDIQRKPINYRQFLMRCFILGKFIANKAKENKNIGILLPNANATAVTFFACHAYGLIPVMLNFSSGSKNILSAISTAKVDTVYSSKKFIETAQLENIIEALIQANINIVFLEDLPSRFTLSHKLLGLLQSYFPLITYKKINPNPHHDEKAVILFTSGSEGVPKGVVHSHQSILANVYQMTARVDFNSRDIAFNALPVFHCFGLTAGMILPIVNGIKTFLYPSPLHYRIIPELVYATNATMFFGTDTFLMGYAKNAQRYHFYSLRYIFAGAEKLKEDTRKIYAEKFGVAVFEGYGATETAPVVSLNTPMQNKNGTIGRLLPQIQCKLEPVKGITEGGKLIVSGPNIMLGYLLADSPDTLKVPEQGWYDTGDIATIDKQGFLKLIGRVKRFAKIAGEMVSLTAVESEVSAKWPDFLNAAVAKPDAKKGEVVIVFTENPKATREELITHFKQNGIADIYIPKKIIHVEKIPVLTTGKIDYVEVNAMTVADE